MGNSFKHWDDRCSLERSLPVVNGEFFQKLGRLGFLRTLATGSEWVILSKIGMIGGPLERSLPVVNGEFFQKLGRLGFLRTLAIGSEWGILSKIWMIGGPLERSLPVVKWDLNGFFKNRDDGEPLERSLPVVNG